MLVHTLVLYVQEISEGLFGGVKEYGGAWEALGLDSRAAWVDAETLPSVSVIDGAVCLIHCKELPHVFHA